MDWLFAALRAGGVSVGVSSAAATAVHAASHTDWTTLIAAGGMVATLISAITGLVVALRHRDGAPVLILTPEQAEELGIGGPDQPSTRRRRRRRTS